MDPDRLLEAIRPVSSVWRASPPAFPKGDLPRALLDRLPADYLALLGRLGPGEGFVGTRYLRLLPLDELAAANAAYQVPRYLPGHQLFGSDGCGNAFLFDLRTLPATVLEVPFVPLDPEYVEAVRPDFADFLLALAAIPPGHQGPIPLTPDPRTHGLELHERHPIALGGNPTDPANKVLLAPPVHAEASCLFNRVFQEVRAQSRRS
jgi:hypothetical protein